MNGEASAILNENNGISGEEIMASKLSEG